MSQPIVCVEGVRDSFTYEWDSKDEVDFIPSLNGTNIDIMPLWECARVHDMTVSWLYSCIRLSQNDA